jgi:hypothetical protein
VWTDDLVKQGKIPAPDLSKAPIMFDADFSKPTSSFYLGKYDAGECQQRDGAYHITKTGDGWWWFGNLPGDVLFSDFACLFVGRGINPRSGGWGCFLKKDTTGLQITLSHDKVCRLQCHLDKGKDGWASLANPVNRSIEHPAIEPYGQTNRLLVILRNRTLELYVNGVAVQRPIELDMEMTPGDIGITILGDPEGGEVELNRITVWSARGLPSPGSRTVPGPP